MLCFCMFMGWLQLPLKRNCTAKIDNKIVGIIGQVSFTQSGWLQQPTSTILVVNESLTTSYAIFRSQTTKVWWRLWTPKRTLNPLLLLLLLCKNCTKKTQILCTDLHCLQFYTIDRKTPMPKVLKSFPKCEVAWRTHEPSAPQLMHQIMFQNDEH